jgi:hypothetical protein
MRQRPQNFITQRPRVLGVARRKLGVMLLQVGGAPFVPKGRAPRDMSAD